MSDQPLERLVENYLRRKYTRREFVIRALAMGLSAPAVTALLSACGAEATPTSPPPTSAPAATAAPAPTATTAPVAAGPRKGGALVYGIHNELQPFDYVTPWMSEAAAVDIYERMLRIDPNGNLAGWLAESFDVSDDGLKITYHLRKGKKFHNGDPCDANAVKALYDWWTDPETDYTQPFYVAATSIEAPDDSTVVVNLDHVDTDAYFGATYLYSPVVNIAVKKANPEEYGRSIAVGTGPYKFQVWEGDSVTTVRFDDYFGPPDFMENKGPGYLDQITYSWLPDQATRSVNLETGDFDMIEQPAPQDIPRLEANPDITVLKRPAPAILYLGFNFKSELLQDRNVREAAFRAIDRNPIIDEVMFGQANPAYSPVVPQDMAYWKDSETLYPYDLEKAKSLLEEAGWTVGANGMREKDGKPLELGIILLGTTEQKTSGQVIQQQLAQVGIKVNLEVLDKGTHQARQLEGDYDMNFFRYWYDSSIAVLKILYHSGRMPPNGANWAYYDSPEADKWFDTFNTVKDLDERIEAIVNVQKALLGDIVQVPIYNPLDIWALNKWVKGFKVQTQMAYNMHNDLWVTEDSPRAKG
jgi:peptide/nickel transport system substrate-binding protein